MSLTLSEGTLLTIIGEAVLQDRLILLLTQANVSGYTIVPAQGAGSHGKRMGDIARLQHKYRNQNDRHRRTLESTFRIPKTIAGKECIDRIPSNG